MHVTVRGQLYRVRSLPNLPKVPGVELRSPGSTSCPMETSQEPLTFRCCPRPWAQHPLLENCTYESTAPMAKLTLKKRSKSLQSLLWDSPCKGCSGCFWQRRLGQLLLLMFYSNMIKFIWLWGPQMWLSQKTGSPPSCGWAFSSQLNKYTV